MQNNKEAIRPYIWLGAGLPVLLAPSPYNIPLSIAWLAIVFDYLYKDVEAKQAQQAAQQQQPQTAGWQNTSRGIRY